MSNRKNKAPVSNPRVFFDIQTGDTPAGQIVFELRMDIASKTSENFRALCTGEKGISKSGFELTYKGCKFTRITPSEVCQCGDFTRKDGTGGESSFQEPFKDETFALKHIGPGILSMVNSGPDTNNSQFFVTFAKLEAMDDAHVAFGYVVEGMDVLRKIESCGTRSGKPTKDVVISNCGQLHEY